MKRVLVLLCTFALVLSIISTGAAAVEPEEYVFELVPDIMYLDTEFSFDWFGDEYESFFYCEHLLTDGSYHFAFGDADQDLFLSVEPVDVVLQPYQSGSTTQGYIPGVYFAHFQVGITDATVSGAGTVYVPFFLLVADTGDEYGSMLYLDLTGGATGTLGEEGSIVRLTRIDDDIVSGSDDGVIISVVTDSLSDFSYSNLGLILLTGLALSVGPTFCWFAYRLIKRKVSRAFFHGKL